MGASLGRKLGYQAFAACMRSHLAPDHHQPIIISVIILISKQSPDPWESFTPRCMQALIMSEAGHSSDRVETIFDTDGLAPPASHRRKRHPTPPRPRKRHLIFLNSSEICFLIIFINLPGKSVNQGWLGSSGYRSAALWQPPSSLLPLRAGHIPQPGA